MSMKASETVLHQPDGEVRLSIPVDNTVSVLYQCRLVQFSDPATSSSRPGTSSRLRAVAGHVFVPAQCCLFDRQPHKNPLNSIETETLGERFLRVERSKRLDGR